MIVTLPPGFGPCASGGGFFSNQTTSHVAVLVHAALFFTILRFVHDDTLSFGYLAKAEQYITGVNF